MLSFSALVCPGCGAPLPADALMRVITCAFCGASVAAEDGLVSAAAFRRALADLEEEARDATDLIVGGHPYRLLGRIGRGESSDVFLATRVTALGERVIVKALRAREDAAFLDREWDVLTALAKSTAQGGPQLSRRLPQLVARGDASVRATEKRPVLVMRAASGFTHTLEEVRTIGAVDGRHAVWMWRRVLELLGWVHKSGFAHAAILPQHLVVHPRDHGVMLVGWSCAARTDARAPLFAVSEAHRGFYPSELLSGAPPSARSDVMMTARCIAYALGGDPASGEVPPSVPAGLAAMIRGIANAPYTDDAWALKEAVAQAAEQAYGPPKYVPFHLPGWPTRSPV